MSIDAKRRMAGAGFVLLLALSVMWPKPVMDINRLCCDAHLSVDELSFLGREAPSWDIAFWCIAGLFFLAIIQNGGEYREIAAQAKRVRLHRSPHVVTFIVVTAVLAAVTWMWIDSLVMAMSEMYDSDRIENVIRYANRFGGGMNPLIIVSFFVIGGVAYRARHWIAYGIAMAIAGAAAGILVQLIKYVVGRTRPELWLGPFHHARAAASSFPSGHTVGAFALAGVLILNGRSVRVRVIALLLASAVAISRVLAFRHWPSDVVASACIGLLCAWVIRVTTPEEPPPYNESAYE